MTEKRSYRPARSSKPERSLGPKSSFKGGRSFVPKGATVYIGNLPYKVTEDDLNKLFGGFGRVRNVHLVKDGKSESKGIAFVKMLKKADAEKAISKVDGRVIGGRTIKCSIAIEGAGNTPAANGMIKTKSKISRPKVDKAEVALVKRERRKTGLQRMLESIKQ